MVQTGSMHSFIATNWFKIKRKEIFHRKHACAQFPVPLTFVPLSSEKVALGLLPSLLASFPSSDLFLFLLNALNSLKIKVYIYLYSYTHILHSISSGYDSSMLHKLPSLDFSSSIILFATVQGAAVRGRKPRTVLLIHRLIQVRRRVTSTCCLPPPLPSAPTCHVKTNESPNSLMSFRMQKPMKQLMLEGKTHLWQGHQVRNSGDHPRDIKTTVGDHGEGFKG